MFQAWFNRLQYEVISKKYNFYIKSPAIAYSNRQMLFLECAFLDWVVELGHDLGKIISNQNEL
ncbi:MAG: hypothetical protein ACI85I_002527 [Arenicella sp.]|jgi:hypothetical protein